MEVIAFAIALLSLVPALLFGLSALGTARGMIGWWQAQKVTFISFAAAIGALLLDLFVAPAMVVGQWVGSSALHGILLVLISFLAVTLVRYARGYLQQERNGLIFLRWLLATLSAVNLVVTSNHLLILLLGWVGISLGLHQLLLFFPERPRAVLAARKKFLFARLAEGCLLVAALLLYYQHGTWFISEIIAAYNQPVELSVSEHLAALLLALAALIKCAQLPVHGWLIQVVEAPTPVSALLHAGIINLGGYLLILFGPLLLQSPVAQGLVLAVAGLTAVLASLVMATRVSVKVRLAWSTSAQMGLMLLEVALGLFELALLHLVAHSCYKAHAFLSAGTAVNARLQEQLAPLNPASNRQWLQAALTSLVFVAVGIWWLAPSGALSPWLLLAMALTVVIAERDSRVAAGGAGRAAGLAVLLILAHALQTSGFALVTHGLSVHWLADLWAALLFLGLGGLTWRLRYRSLQPDMQRLEVLLFAGFYLDEWVTRTTLRIWPKSLTLPRADVVALEVQKEKTS